MHAALVARQDARQAACASASVGIAGFVFISQHYFARVTSDLDTRRVNKTAL